MNSEIKTLWIAALNSGDYKQGFGFLHEGECFCAMGVLADLYLKEKGLEWKPHPDSETLYAFDLELGLCCSCISQDIMDWAGMNWQEENKITRMNDGEKRTFADIADYL